MSFAVFSFRRGIKAQWNSANPVLFSGEFVLETDTNQFKVGNGITPYNSLPYGGVVGPQGVDGYAAYEPILAIESDGLRRVLKISGWTGGSGPEPEFDGYYIGPTGLVADIASGSDIRGPAGAAADGDYGDIIVSGSGTVWSVQDSTITNAKLADVANSTIKGRVSASTGAVEDLTSTQATSLLNTFTPSLKGLVPASGGGTTTFLRADGSFAILPPGNVPDLDYGDITVTGDGYIWTIDNNVVTNVKLRDSGALSVIGRSASTSGDPADISATLNSGSVLREDGAGQLGFGTVSTAGIADDAITFAKLQNIATNSLIGRDAAGTGSPAEISLNATLEFNGADQIQRAALTGDVTATAGSNATTIGANTVTNAKLSDVATATIKGRITAGSGDPEDLTGTEATSLLDVFTSSAKGLVPLSGGGTSNFLRADGSFSAIVVPDADYGDISISSGTWTIDSNTITNTKLRDSAALSVVGRSVNTIGDPADIAATATSGAVLREDGAGNIGFGTVATAGIANTAVTFAKMQNVATDRLLGRDTALSGAIEEISLNSTLEFSGTGSIQRAALTGDVTAAAGSNTTAIAANAVTNAKLATVSTSTFKGRTTAGTGNVEDLTTAQATALLDLFSAGTKGLVPLSGGGTVNFLRADGSFSAPLLADSDYGDIVVSSSGTVISVDANAITNTKLRDSGALSVIGRSANTTGDPADIAVTANSGLVLREDGAGALSFGTVGTAGISASAVTFAKIQNIATDRLLGRDTALSGATEEIGLNATLEFTGTGSIQRAALTGDVTATAGSNTTLIAANAVTNAKMATVGTATFKGRTTAGTGNVEDLTATQATALLDVFDSTTKGLVPVSGGGTTNFLRADGTFSAPTFSLADADYGDIVVSSSGSVLTIDANSVTNTKLRDSGALSVIGRSANTTGDPADISAAANSGSVLREDGAGAIGFGTIGSAGIANTAVTFAKIQNISTDKLIGRDTALSGTTEEIGLNATLEFTGTGSIQRAALTGDVTATAGSNATAIASNVVTNSKLATVSTLTFKGRTTAGTGNVEDLTATQATAMLDVFDSATKGLVPASGGGTTTFLRADGSFASPTFSLADADYGDITVSGSGTILTIDPNVVTNGKFRTSAALSVVGRSANTTGNVADISATATSGAVLREDGAGNIGFGTVSSAGIAGNAVTFAKMQTIATDSLLGRDTAGTGIPESISLNSTLEFTGSSAIQRAALTGDVTASAGSNSTTIASNVVSNAKLATVSTSTFKGRTTAGTGNVEDLTTAQATALLDVFNSTTKGLVPLSGGGTTNFLRADGAFAVPVASLADADYGDIVVSSSGTVFTVDANSISNTKLRDSGALSVIGRSVNTTGDPADISAVANSGSVLREDGAGTVGFGTVGTAGITNSAVTFAKIQNISTDRLLGRDTALSGATEEIGLNSTLEFTGTGSIQRAALTGDVTATAGSNTTAIGSNVVSNAKLATVSTATFKGRTTAGTGNVEDLTATQATALLDVFGSSAKGLVPASGGGTTTFLRADGSFSVPTAVLADADYGDIVVSGAGTVFTVDANTITNAKLRTSGALSVVGRSVNTSGNVADISATATSSSVLREDGAGNIGFGTIATAGIADSAITDAKLRNSGALSVIGRSANTSGVAADISAVASSGSVMRENGSGAIGFGTISTAGIADSAVTFAKMQTVATDRLLGRDTAGTGAVEAISLNATLEFSGAGAIQRAALTGDITASAGSNATAIANTVVTNAKLSDVATATFKGRTTAGTGSPEDLTVTQATAMLDVFTSGLKGLVPASGGGTTTFLRADGSFASPTSALADGDYGDVTVSGSGTAITVDANAIANSKLATVSTATIKGRVTAGTGNVEDLSASQVKSVLSIGDVVDNLTTASSTDMLSAGQGKTLQDTKQKIITSGTAAPSGGSSGDIYIQYT